MQVRHIEVCLGPPAKHGVGLMQEEPVRGLHATLLEDGVKLRVEELRVEILRRHVDTDQGMRFLAFHREE